MASTEFYIIRKDGGIEHYADVPQAMAGAMAIWINLERKYLPSLPPGKFDREGEYISRLVRGFTLRLSGAGGPDPLDELWGIAWGKETTHADRILMASTFDGIYVAYEDLKEVAEAYRGAEFATVNMLSQANVMEDITREFRQDEVIGIWKNETSVNSVEDFFSYDANDTEYERPRMGEDWESLMDVIREYESKTKDL